MTEHMGTSQTTKHILSIHHFSSANISLSKVNNIAKPKVMEQGSSLQLQ